MSPNTFALALATAGALASSAAASIGWSDCNHSFVPSGLLPHPDQPQPKAAQVCRAGELAISYDNEMLVPAFSAYRITKSDVDHELPGRRSFYEDPDLKKLGVQQASVHSHAFNSSWNRGHLCPSHILSWTDTDKKATYTAANIAPQAAYFNQRTWATLENNAFDFIKKTGRTLHIVTGVAYKDRANPRRSWDDIAVPDYYWKAVCDVNAGISAAFAGSNLPGRTQSLDTWKFRTVHDVEKIFGGRIFPIDVCNTEQVDPSKWWSFPSQFQRVGI